MEKDKPSEYFQGDGNKQPLRVLVFSSSMRSGSLNTKLALLAGKVIERHDVTVDVSAMKDFDCPSYNQDKEASIPEGAELLHQKLATHDAIVISSPEYNASMPGHLKNVIDWVSRFRPQPFNEKHVLLLSASPSMVGGNRGLWSLRIPLEHLGARVFPDMFSLAMAHQAFSAEGAIANTTLAQRFESTLTKFIELAEAAKHYPCIKKAWVEFLGERPDPVTERVE